jgi:ATP-binding cassette, subfamily B (MDR/TAP), member 1
MPTKDFLKRGNFLALMFVVQAFSVAAAFLVLGWSAALIAADVSTHYRQEYLENILKRRISFFDNENNTAGTLASRLSIDSSRVKELLGGEMALQLVAFFGIIGSVIIAFCYGWKLSLVGILTIMPIAMLAGYYRVHLERYFENLNAEVFSETAQFGSEAIGAFRTVTALTMENSIIDRFDNLLKAHIHKAVKQSRLSTIVFAFSESADMFMQPLFFWYHPL